MTVRQTPYTMTIDWQKLLTAYRDQTPTPRAAEPHMRTIRAMLRHGLIEPNAGGPLPYRTTARGLDEIERAMKVRRRR